MTFSDWCKRPQVWGSAVSVVVMALIAFFFFYPDNVEGRVLDQPDLVQGMANGQEGKAFYEATGERALWTDALFGGMPTFQISPTYPSNALFTWLNTVYGLGLPAPSNLLFMMMLGFFILLVSLRLRWWYALIGAVAWGLSSYFVIIIGAGHIWKFVTLTYIPPTIAGLVLVYRARYITGGAVLALFAMLQLNANHPQMSYYFGFVMFGLVIAWLIRAVKTKTLRIWWRSTAVAIVAGGLAVGANLPSLYNTYEYAKYTKRAQSELSAATPAVTADPSAPRPTGGMPYGEIVGWSYGTSETFSLIVPNIKGGATAKPIEGRMSHLGLDRLPEAEQYKNQPIGSLLPYLTQYYNDSEGTNGPVYVGAIIFALFLTSLWLVRGPEKWALVIVTILSILLAWGANFAWLTDLFIYNVPLYNKFRAVESILVIAEFTIPLLAILALAQVIEPADEVVAHRRRRALIGGFGITAVVALAAAVAPGLFGDAITSTDSQMSAEMGRQVAQMGQQYGYGAADIQGLVYDYSLSNPDNVKAVTALRHGLTEADGWRSFAFLCAGFAILWLFVLGRMKAAWAVGVTGFLVLIDLYPVDKRYVDHESFVESTQATVLQGLSPDAIDQMILNDTSHYRVMDVPGFWSPNRSYFHHTIGGYHAAKLNRYEDLIQRLLAPAVNIGYYPDLRSDSVRATFDADQRANADRLAQAYRVLDMLNAKYIVTGRAEAPLMVNTHAFGPAWLVDSIEYVNGARAEMSALESLDPRRQAVADTEFASALGSDFESLVPGDTVVMTSYTPNEVTYRTDCHSDAVAVFSEIYFPWGWQATIDGEPAVLGRVNYVLRALRVPAGQHEVAMRFDPQSLHVTGSVAYACVSIIYILVLLALFVAYRRTAGCKE